MASSFLCTEDALRSGKPGIGRMGEDRDENVPVPTGVVRSVESSAENPCRHGSCHCTWWVGDSR